MNEASLVMLKTEARPLELDNPVYGWLTRVMRSCAVKAKHSVNRPRLRDGGGYNDKVSSRGGIILATMHTWSSSSPPSAP